MNFLKKSSGSDANRINELNWVNLRRKKKENPKPTA
jgi:hypothetical protein